MSFPKWVDRRNEVTDGLAVSLREVGNFLFVGGRHAALAEGGPPVYETVIYLGQLGMQMPPARRVVEYPILDQDGAYTPRVIADMRELWRQYLATDTQDPLLVACDMGASRSAATAYMFLRMGYFYSPAKALHAVTLAPGVLEPRADFIRAIESALGERYA